MAGVLASLRQPAYLWDITTASRSMEVVRMSCWAGRYQDSSGCALAVSGFGKRGDRKAFKSFPFVPNLEGQSSIRNLVPVSGALVIGATSR